jgi:cytochrome bd ubiquinol oxidase subunit II
MNYIFLQQYWWFLISLLGAILVFLLFVQGGQTLIYRIGKNDLEQTMLINSLGRKWEFTFTTLVTFGGAFFASFPLFYSTSFGGAYWLWMIILFCFIVQAVSYEYRSKKGNLLGKRVYEIFLFINGVGGLFLLGTFVGTMFNGSDFIVNKSNLTDIANPVISSWTNSLHGLESILNPFNTILGIAVFFLARSLASLYFINSINDETIEKRSRKQLMINIALFLLFFLTFLVYILLKNGFAVDAETGTVFMEKSKYFHNLIEMPVLLLLLLLGVVSLLFGVIKSLLKTAYKKGIWFAGTGTILVVLVLFLIAGWNNTSYYPSNADIQSSLTIQNSSSSFFTLKVMSIVSLLIPFVAAYIFYAWRAINKKPIDKDEMLSKDHKY